MSRRLLRAAVLMVGAVVACENPFEPKGDGERIPINLVIEQQVTSDTTRFYSFTTTPGAVYAVFLQSLVGDVWLNIVDSATHQPVASLTASPIASTPRLEDNAVATFGSAQSRRVFEITVRNFRVGTTARFRFKIYQVNLDPERLSARIEIGDTVAGEMIDPKVDIDRFFVHGTAGQEIVVVGETQGAPGSGSVAFDVVDTEDTGLLGYVFADAGAPTLTTGRMRFPASRDYRLAASSVISNTYPRYHGPYRFWSYQVNRAPEHRAAAMPSNTEIQSEGIEHAGDVDEFTFQANPGDAFMAFVQSARPLHAEMTLPNGPPLAIAACQASSDTGLFARVTNRLQVTQVGNYVLRVTGTNPYQIADTGRYRLFLYAIDRRPEHVPAAIPSGVAVLGEALDRPGDVDEFTFDGVAGEQVDAFFQAQNGSPDDRLEMDVIDPAGVVYTAIHSTGTDTSLFRQVTGRFALPSTGTYRLRVTGYDGYCAPGYRGPYQIFLHRVNGRPETVPDTLAFGDSLSGESLDLPGDYDEFHVTVPDSSGANLAFELDAPGGLTVTLINAATGSVVASASGGGRTATGRLSLAPGTYIVRVDASVQYDNSVVRGPYRLWFYRFGLGPETVPDTLAIGDTVSGEEIEPWGDADAFRFYGVRGQHVNIGLQGLAAPGGTFQAWIHGPPGAPEYQFAIVSSPSSSGALGDHQTRRLDLTATGWYHLTVFGAEGMGIPADRGAYRFAVQSLGVAPEVAGSALVPGDSVTTESIDTQGDWDEFTLTAAPGQEVYVLFHGAPIISVRDPTTGDSLAARLGWQYDKLVDPVRVPAGGQVKIAAYQPAAFVRFCYDATCGGVLPFVGPYAFRVVPLNRAPEMVPGTYAFGDTVRGEIVSPIGDIDELTATGTPGDTLSVWWRLTADPVPTDGLITLEILDATTGTVIGGAGGSLFRASPTFYSQGAFVVPTGGAYLVRIHSYGSFGDNIATAPYEFFVKQGQ
jgi:hypothetical protein